MCGATIPSAWWNFPVRDCTGLFVYASTSEILHNAIARPDFLQTQPFSRVWLEEGEILHLSADGQIETRTFDTRRLQSLFYAPWGWPSSKNFKRTLSEDLSNTARNLGFEEEDVMILQGCGYWDEIEELLQAPELFRAAQQESYYESAVYRGGLAMRTAYVRVSTAEQNEQRQIDALAKHDIERWFTEKVSGKDTNHPQLQAMLEFAREGDTIYVHDFSRLARSTSDLLKIVELLQRKKIHLVSNKENIDTSTPSGKPMMTRYGFPPHHDKASWQGNRYLEP